jgi:ribosomal protein S18 acetylase RimI-like enzyme
VTRAAVDRLAVRAFTPSDRDDVVRLMRELQRFERAFIPEHAAPDQAFGEWYVDRLLGVLREQDGVLLVATHDGTICGFGAGYVDEDPEARSQNFYIAELSVTERLRGHGIGSRLIAALEDAARTRGLATVVIGVLAASTRVHGLYARLGYRDRAIRMRKKLGPPA